MNSAYAQLSQEHPVWRTALRNIDLSRTRFMRKWNMWDGLWHEEGVMLPGSRISRGIVQEALPKRTLRFLSYNIQAGLHSAGYSDYLRNGFKQILPAADRLHLDKISSIVSDFDIVMLQEVDCGSIRSGFVNQLEYLAEGGAFGFFHQQLNRNVGKFGQFSNGLLSRFSPASIENHCLPGLKGRGAIIARFALPHDMRKDSGLSTVRRLHDETLCRKADELVVIGLHLALGGRSRAKQIEYVMDVIAHEQYVILMGDLNCCEISATQTALGGSGLSHLNFGMDTFPSWSPRKCIDHIWVSKSLAVESVEVLPHQLSDHRPLAAHIDLHRSCSA